MGLTFTVLTDDGSHLWELVVGGTIILKTIFKKQEWGELSLSDSEVGHTNAIMNHRVKNNENIVRPTERLVALPGGLGCMRLTYSNLRHGIRNILSDNKSSYKQEEVIV
jgi:hypothetical protein